MNNIEFFIFRHGETDWNLERRFQGHTDIPLNATGLRQAQDLKTIIEKISPVVFITSDLQRAHSTAQIVNADEIHHVLQRTMTVGALKQMLAKLDDSLPVELEVIVEITEDGDCAAQPGLAIHHYEVTEDDDGFPRLTLVGVPPQLAEAYAEAFELAPLRQ